MSFKVGDEVEIISLDQCYSSTNIPIGTQAKVIDTIQFPSGSDNYDLIIETLDFSFKGKICRNSVKLVVKTPHKVYQEAHVSPTGSLRFNSGKQEQSHIAPEFLMEFGSLMTASAKKYSKYNYSKGQYLSTALDSLDRHLLAFKNSEDVDPESMHSHLIHIAANAMILWCTVKYHLEDHPELDDRFKKVLGLK